MDEEIAKMERMYATSINDVMMDHHYRYHYALNYIRQGDFVLDVACGSGYGTHYMAEHSASAMVIGLDRSDHALKWAFEHFWHEKVTYMKTDLALSFQENLPIQQFDVIVCFETVEHIHDDKSYVKKLYDLLKKNGTLIISAPNENVIPHLDNPYYPDRVNPHHIRHYRPNELMNLMTDYGGFCIQQLLTQDNTTYKVVPERDDGFTTILVATK